MSQSAEMTRMLASYQRLARDMGRSMAQMAEAAARAGAILGRAFREAFEPLGRLELVVDDPARADIRLVDRTSLGALARQVRDIAQHEFWMAAGEPERSPGARWVRRPRR